MVVFSAIPDGDREWDNKADKILLQLLMEKRGRIDLDRTIMATGVIVLVAEELNFNTGMGYTVGEVLKRINYLKKRYLAFKWFASYEGVIFNSRSLKFTVGHAYFMFDAFVSENPVHTRFRVIGEPLYEELVGVFDGRGIGTIHLEWVYAYFTGDAAAMQEMLDRA